MDLTNVAGYWEANAENWTRFSRAGYDVYRDALNTPAFLAMLPPGAQILELGTGGGQDAAFMLEQGFAVIPTDGSPELAAEAEKARIMAAAEADAKRLRVEAERQIAAEIERARRELRTGVIEAAVAAADATLRRSIAADDQKKMAEKYVADVEYRDVERPAAEVEHGDLFVLLLVESVGERGGGGLVDDAHPLLVLLAVFSFDFPFGVEPGNLGGVDSRLALCVIKVRGDGDDRFAHGVTEVGLGGFLQFAQDQR